jgi:hypothetical protein
MGDRSVIFARLCRRLRREQRGNLSIELAFAAPVIASLLLVGVEFTRYMLIHQKVERTAATIADLVAQSQGMSEAEMNSLFSATDYVMEPFDLGADGNVVVSSISAMSGGAARITWQRSHGAGTGGSAFGEEGDVADLPTGLIVREGESLIATEAYYQYEPLIFQDILEPTMIYRWSVFRPRFAPLDTIDP